MSFVQRFIKYALLIGAMMTTIGAAAQPAYPNKPITVVVPFSAGGPTDALARILCQRMGEALGQQMIVENRGSTPRERGFCPAGKVSSR